MQDMYHPLVATPCGPPNQAASFYLIIPKGSGLGTLALSFPRMVALTFFSTYAYQRTINFASRPAFRMVSAPSS